jgi:hypothetical protein
MNKDLGLDAATRKVFQPREGGRRLLAINLATVVCPTSLVPPHSGFDRLDRGQSSSGRCCGSTSSSMLRAVLGCLLMNPARSSVNTIW